MDTTNESLSRHGRAVIDEARALTCGEFEAALRHAGLHGRAVFDAIGRRYVGETELHGPDECTAGGGVSRRAAEDALRLIVEGRAEEAAEILSGELGEGPVRHMMQVQATIEAGRAMRRGG